MNHFSIGQMNSENGNLQIDGSNSQTRDLRNFDDHYRTLPAIPKNQNEKTAKVSRGDN